MTAKNDSSAPAEGGKTPTYSLCRLWPLVVIVLLIGVVYAMGWQRELSLETLLRHRSFVDGFVAQHRAAAVAAFVVLYIAVAALSIPAGAVLTTVGGFLFGAIVGGLSAMLGATIGSSIIFVIAKSAVGEHLVRRVGPLAARFADGFRANAFSYMLFLRLVPFPFWLVNLLPAFFDVRLTTFVAATVIGIVPATFAFAFFGAGLDSALSAQQSAYQACLAAGRANCEVELHPTVTPELLAALAALFAVGLIPIIAKWMRARSGPISSAH
jgi:uncharacterized membrane protein YdjX (TVP38/TMEM64 family)